MQIANPSKYHVDLCFFGELVSVGCLLHTQHFTLLTKGMLADCQSQQVPRGPALFWRAGIGGGVPGQGRLVTAGQSAAAAGGQ